MSDLISREEALNVLQKKINDVMGTSFAKYRDGLCVAFHLINKIPSADTVHGWIPLSHDDDGMGTDFPYERDGEWVIVTDGKNISVERIKKDAYDHFFPNGRWFELEDVIAWMPLPTPYKGGDNE